MSHPRISLVHPTGNPNSRETALALSEENLLYEIVTTIAYDPQSYISKYLKILPDRICRAIEDELGRRLWVAPEGVKMRSHPWEEIGRIALKRIGWERGLGIESGGLIDPIYRIYSSLDRHVARHHLQGIDAVYAYEDAAAATFEAAKERGILCLYDLPILFHRMSREIQALEAELFPDLAPVMAAVNEPEWKIERKEREVRLADRIFVASSITKKSLLDAGIEAEKIGVVPYGAPVEYFHPQPKPDRIFRALSVGRIGPRKGTHYLLQAWQELQLTNAELLLIGTNVFPSGWLEKYSDVCRYVSCVPHAALNTYYSSASVFVFPSLVEGFGLVLLEAMASGIPIITTCNTAGPDIITDGVEGFIIPIRDVESLKEKLEWCYRHPQELAEMGRFARQTAEKLTWNRYRKKLLNEVRQLWR
ncbi:MAG: glycosyltransferase family 4 protein [Cyanosarcina radialis HA8281-LM2]|jgi:glycosyltransferase involved in cell wall biosynthesis|nr:glycosyltransferase family 4 protein [Cyanosarcina radialis HA8281-LM2]